MLNIPLSKFRGQYPQFQPYFNTAQSFETYPPYKLRVDGKGSIQVQPDIAIVTLGAFTVDKELKAAQEENSVIINNIIEAVEAMGISSKDIQTESYTITPEYDYIEGKQIFRGFRVTHTLRITIRDISKVGEVVDVAVQQGANIVNNITFTISDPSKYYQKALTYAIDDAISKAMTIGNKLRVMVSRTPIRIIEKSFTPSPSMQPMMLQASQGATPIQSGQIEITAEIEAIFNYSSLRG